MSSKLEKSTPLEPIHYDPDVSKIAGEMDQQIKLKQLMQPKYQVQYETNSIWTRSIAPQIESVHQSMAANNIGCKNCAKTLADLKNVKRQKIFDNYSRFQQTSI